MHPGIHAGAITVGQGLETETLVTAFRSGLYAQPVLVNPPTVKFTDGVDVLLSVELFTLHVPADPVVHVVAPEPADQVPVTVTPATGVVPVSRTPIVTVAVQAVRPDFAGVPTRLPTRMSWDTGGGPAAHA